MFIKYKALLRIGKTQLFVMNSDEIVIEMLKLKIIENECMTEVDTEQ